MYFKFPGGVSPMSGFPSSLGHTGMHSWTSHSIPQAQGSSPQSLHTPPSPSFVTSGAPDTQSRLPTHVTELQMTPHYLDDQPTPIPRRTPLPCFPAYPLSAQFASGPLHTSTRYNRFPGQHVTPSHSGPFHSQPSQPHPYHACHQVESNPYPATGYFPLPPHQPLYFWNEPRVQASHLSYEQTQPPLPIHQASISIPPGSFGGIQQCQPLPRNSTSHFELPQQYPRSVHQWHDGHPHLSGDTSALQAQQHYPTVNYPRSHRLRTDLNTLKVQSTDSERLSPSSPSQGPSNNSIVVTPSPYTVSASITDSPEKISVPVQESPNISASARDPRIRLAASTSFAHQGPLARRHYHPNPPHNQSKWVMWVGNVPSDAAHDELWRFLDRSAHVPAGSKVSGQVKGSGLVSIFLISRSNCAFVNYRSEEQMKNAIAEFNGHQLRPNDRRCPSLVCRARRKENELRAGVGAQRGIGVHSRHVRNLVQKDELVDERTPLSKGRRSGLGIVTSDPTPAPPAPRDSETSKSAEEVIPRVPTHSSSSYASTTSSFLLRHFPRRLFILKSLNQYDLDLSVERGIWATQKHNEAILNQAFRTSKEVILIFSVNKSGEFYGYARMASDIFHSSYSISWAPTVPPPRGSLASSSGFPFDTLEQQSPPVHHSPEIKTLPSDSEPRVARAIPLPVAPSWAPRTDPSPSASPSPLPSHPSEPPEATLFPVAPSSDKTEDSQTDVCSMSTQARRSAPPAFYRASNDDDPLLQKPPLTSSFSCSNKGWPVTLQLPKDSGSSSLQTELLGKDFGVGAGARSNGIEVDDAGGVGSHSRLQPVMEEVHGGSGAEGDVQLQPTSFEARRGRAEALHEKGTLGDTFRIEWLRTERIPFHRTRHLRNPWNHGREIKVARDGTEIEPTVGQQLIEEWPSLFGSAGKRSVLSVTAGGPSRSKNAKV